ncbi:MAG: hypothetical protein ACXVPU_16755 [Bacteroidia bacterium]
MEKEIINQIVNQLNSFKNHQLLILIIAFLLFTLVTISQTIYTSKLIEKFRNQLKKAELKFSVFNEMQISKLSELFVLTNNLKGALAEILGSIERSENQIKLGNWKSSYSEFDKFYSSNKYIIPSRIKLLMTDNQNNLINYNANICLLKEKFDLVDNKIENLTEKEKLKSLEMIDYEIFGFNSKKSAIELMILAENIKVYIEEYFDNIE